MKQTRLIIVDDEEFIRLPIKDYFEDCGWNVDVFSTAEDALEYLKNESAECVIVDMRLPGMTGIDFITEAHRLRPEIRFVIYTGSIDFSITEELHSAGVNDSCIVRKPVINLIELKIAVEGKNREV